MSTTSRRWLIVIVITLGALLAACGQGDLPWADDFSDTTSGWLAESDASAEVKYHDGVMRIFIKMPNSLAWASAEREFSDLRLAVEATQAGGPDDNEYGVIVRMQDPGHFYLFSISGDGYYQVSKYDDDGRIVLGDDWLASDAIHIGTETNLLEVVCQGTVMTFFVNGTQLVEIKDSSYSRGDVGLYAGSFFEPDVDIHFDNLRVDSP